MNKHIKIIMVQVIFLVAVLIAIYFLYPKTEINVNENIVDFKSINANVIIISENPDFSNPRYLEIEEGGNATLNLDPGTYYWKADNGIIGGMKNEIVIKSEVGLEINRTENKSELVNIGNVKINVTRNEEGVLVGYVTLEPDKSEEIEDKGEYIGRQND